MMTTLPSCMDRYMNRYMVASTPTHHHLQGQPPVGPTYFHQNGGGVAPPPSNQGNQTTPSCGGGFMMNCYQNANGWTGVPLISTASRRPRKQQQQQHHQMPLNKPPPSAAPPPSSGNDYDENAMSRLAIHAHGAPLILTGGRTYHRGKPPLVRHPQQMQKMPTQQCFNSSNSRIDDFTNYDNPHHRLLSQQNQQAITADTFALGNSDESSSTSSSNSHTPDTCLPRIIKPRKRRKKERKPNSCQNSPVTLGSTMMVGKNNCGNANSGGVSLMKSLPLVTTATQTTTIQEFTDKNSPPGNNSVKVNSTAEELSSCSCRLCDPFCRIWAFPLRRSCSDNSGEVEATRRNVGVIGSHIKSTSNEWRSTPQLCNQQPIYGTNIDGSRKGSLSDSGDSGCDLLSGLNFATDDLWQSDHGKSMPQAPPPCDERVCDFQLTDNCWEMLSRRVMESLDLRGDDSDDRDPNITTSAISAPSSSCLAGKSTGGSDCVSSDSGSVFSDGTPECYPSNYHEPQVHLGVQIANFLLDNQQPQLPIYNSGCYPSQQNYGNGQRKPTSIYGDLNPFYSIQEKDRGNEILSCIDMVWNGVPQLMPVEE
ncbi:hypothetical protein DMENIID0001_081790 [Sergentomyia squamirostris]